MTKRFPIEPSSEAYTPNEYNINSAGLPCYNAGTINYKEPEDIYLTDAEYLDGVMKLIRSDGHEILVNIDTNEDIYLQDAEYSNGTMTLTRSDGHEIQVEIGTNDDWFEGD